jgi:hypothetical protein
MRPNNYQIRPPLFSPRHYLLGRRPRARFRLHAPGWKVGLHHPAGLERQGLGLLDLTGLLAN